MSETNAWKYLTVQSFLERYNWSGQTLTVQPEANDFPDASGTVSWERQTVHSFFRNFNWTGQYIEQTASVSEPQSFSPRLSVQEFFQFFAWEGQPNIAALPSIPPSSPIANEDDLDLDDFSNMF